MAADNFLLNLSGTISGFIGSQAVNISLLVGQSGATFIPIRVTNDGTIITSGVN